jgi:hypothetical protein
MKRYIPLKERTINQLYQDVDQLYNKHKSEFVRLTDLIDFIVRKLHVSPGVIMQILQSL